MSMSITILPNRKERESAKSLRARGYLLSNVRGKSRPFVVAHAVPVLRTVVTLRPSVVESIFEFARRPQ